MLLKKRRVLYPEELISRKRKSRYTLVSGWVWQLLECSVGHLHTSIVWYILCLISFICGICRICWASEGYLKLDILIHLDTLHEDLYLKGPRDLGKYKISSDYWENRPLAWYLDFLKDVWNIEISIKEPKNTSAFFACVPWFSFILEIFSTLLTLHCLKCLFHMNSHINQVVNVRFVGKVSRLNATSENISKTSTWFFLVPGRRF